MSAPDTDVKKQARRHRGPILGIAFGVFFAALLFFAYLGWAWEPQAESEPSAVTVETN